MYDDDSVEDCIAIGLRSLPLGGSMQVEVNLLIILCTNGYLMHVWTWHFEAVQNETSGYYYYYCYSR